MAEVQWDYTDLAESYSLRPQYAAGVIDELVNRGALVDAAPTCDVGAGTGHLSVQLAARGVQVDAVEPNDAMRAIGIERTHCEPRIRWFDGTGEATGRPSNEYRAVMFGSSFNVVDASLALEETARLLRPAGLFACIWNHRVLSDPLQAEIEAVIHGAVPAYDYGTRRSDPTDAIDASGRFGKVVAITAGLDHVVDADEWKHAWRSHATLARQAGPQFPVVLELIDAIIDRHGTTLCVPYETRAWCARIHG